MFIVKLTTSQPTGTFTGYVGDDGNVVDHLFQAKTFGFKDEAQKVAGWYAEPELKVKAKVISTSAAKHAKSFVELLAKSRSR